MNIFIDISLISAEALFCLSSLLMQHGVTLLIESENLQICPNLLRTTERTTSWMSTFLVHRWTNSATNAAI